MNCKFLIGFLCFFTLFAYGAQAATPGAPTSLATTSVATGSVAISWASSSGATFFTVYRSLTSSVTSSIATTSALVYTDSSVSAGTTYYYKVSASNGEGEGATTTALVQKTLSDTPTSLATTSVATGSIGLSWVSSTGATLFNIYRDITSSVNTLLTTSTDLTYTDSSVSAGTTYYYKVSAVNGSGEGATTSALTQKTLSSAPTSLSAYAVSLNQINLEWASSTGATSFNIYKGPSASSLTYLTNTSNLVYSNTGLGINTTYYYEVSAVNESGEGATSTDAHAVTFSGGGGGGGGGSQGSENKKSEADKKTIATLTARIQALMKMIQLLQQQQGINQNTNPGLAIGSLIKNVNPGEKGDAVILIQTKLKTLGFYDYPEITGYFGAVTRNAVIKFQQSKGIQTTGIVGPLTRAALDSN
jgi:fibronectin type 3 domain-containing protein